MTHTIGEVIPLLPSTCIIAMPNGLWAYVARGEDAIRAYGWKYSGEYMYSWPDLVSLATAIMERERNLVEGDLEARG